MPTRALYTPFFSDMPDHPDTQKLALLLSSLGMPAKWAEAYAYAAILPLNCWCLEFSPSGELTHLPDARLAAICRWPGSRPGAFRTALRQAGFIDTTDDREFLHNFAHYNRRLLADRARRNGGQSTDNPRIIHGHSAPDPPPIRGKVADDPRKRSGQSTDNPRIIRGVAAGKVRRRRKDVDVKDTKVNGREAPEVDVDLDLTATSTAGANARPLLLGRNPDVRSQNPEGSKAKTDNGNALVSESKPVASDGTGLEPEGAQGSDSNAPTLQHSNEEFHTWTIFAEQLRRAGWGEANTRRIVKWGLDKFRARVLAIDWFWRVLAMGLVVEETRRRRARAKQPPLTDPVSYLIVLANDGTARVQEEHLKLARRGWAAIEKELTVPEARAKVEALLGDLAAAWGVGQKAESRSRNPE